MADWRSPFSRPFELNVMPIAAGRIGRRSIGIEMDRHYFDIAKQRVADELSDDWLQASQDEAIHALENRIEAAVK